MKRIMSWMLALCMLISIVPITVFASSTVASGTCGENLSWSLDGYGVLTIFGTGEMYDYESFSAPWYQYRSQVTHLKVEKGVTTIGLQAFLWMDNIISIELPKTLLKIGRWAFACTNAMTEIVLPSGLTEIGESAFQGCESLKRVVIPGSVKIVDTLAFASCANMEKIVLGYGVETIGLQAFGSTSKLSNIIIPASVTTIEDAAFSFSGLEIIRFEGDAPVFNVIGDNDSSQAFADLIATVYYPAGNPTWTKEVMQDYYGDITWVPYTVYKVVDDSDTSVVVGKSETAVLHIDATLSNFVGVEVDGEAVGAANYTLTEGSIIITFSADYLDTLSVGEHKVSVEFTDGYAYSELVISEKGPCDDGHTEESIPGKAPTCTETGLTEGKKCSVCGEIIIAQQTIPALGHDFEDGSCTVCGEADPDYVAPEKPTDPVEPEEPELDGVIRIAGDDRIATSLMLADQLKDVLGVEKFDAVVVASALNFPDALTGSYLAAEKNAPILLTYPAAHAKIRAYIQENLKPGGMVYILGGEGAVSADFADGLDGFNIKRLAGSDRFGTNLAIMEEAGVSADQPVLIATAVNFADSLSASAAGLPMVLVYGSLREDQKEFLATTSRNFIIIGGEAAVSKSLENELAAIGSVTRVAGSSRYETSVLVAERFVQNPDAVILAYAKNFPDGLCGGPLAYALGAPLILTDNSGYSTADTYVSGISAGIVVGGTGLISDETANQIFDK